MKVYIAAPYSERDAAIEVMLDLEARGLTVTSTWLRKRNEMTDAWAKRDLEDVRRSKVLLFLNYPQWMEKGRGGRHVELGYALAYGLRIVLVGERTNIFHHHSTVQVVPSVMTWLESIGKLYGAV